MSIFDYNGKSIFYELDGNKDNPKLLILNGIMMSTKSWAPFMNTLKENFYVLRMDFFDQGESHKLVGESYKQEIQLDLLKDLLDYLKFDSINIVGISYGGNAALGFACKYPKYVKRLMLFNSAAYTSPWLKDIGEGWIEAGKTRNGNLYYNVAIPTIYSAKYYESKLDWMKARQRLLTPLFSNADFLDAMERLTRSAESYDVREKLHELNLPVMIISAEADTLTPVKDQEYLFKNIKGAKWIKLPEVGHASMYEEPLIFTTLITGFFLVKDTEYII